MDDDVEEREGERELDFDCPCCGEPNTVDAWSLGRGERSVQDCWVCCRPVEIVLHEGPDGERWIEARSS